MQLLSILLHQLHYLTANRRLLFIYIIPSVPRLRISVRTYTLAGGFARVGPNLFRPVINAPKPTISPLST